MSLQRRKSMRAVDRAPSVINRPSNSPIHLMIRPDAKKLSKTTGEDARQYSSFTADGLFPHTLEENKAPRGFNDIDKELLAENRKVERAQLALLHDSEHSELEAELNRIIRLPLVDFLKMPPTTDPHTMVTTTVSPSASMMRAISPPQQSPHMMLSVRPQSAPGHYSGTNHNIDDSRSVLSRVVSPTTLSITSPSALEIRPTSSASQRPASAASSLQFGVAQRGVTTNVAAVTSVTSAPLVVPTTTPGSRPTTPLVYIGGRVNIDCTATLSRPTSAAGNHNITNNSFVGAGSAQRLIDTSVGGIGTSTGGAVGRLGRHSSKARLASTPAAGVAAHQAAFAGDAGDIGSSFAAATAAQPAVGGSGGHLQLIIRGTATAATSSAVDSIAVGDGSFRLVGVGGKGDANDRLATSTAGRLATATPTGASPYRSASVASIYSNGSSSTAAGGHPAHQTQATHDTSVLMHSSPYAHLLQRHQSNRSSAAAASLQNSAQHDHDHSRGLSTVGSALRLVHQRHQSQTRKQHGFNISTSYISHEPDAAMYDVALSAMLRNASRPGSAAASTAQGTGAAASGAGGSVDVRDRQQRPQSAIVSGSAFPLRAVFLQ